MLYFLDDTLSRLLVVLNNVHLQGSVHRNWGKTRPPPFSVKNFQTFHCDKPFKLPKVREVLEVVREVLRRTCSPECRGRGGQRQGQRFGSPMDCHPREFGGDGQSHRRTRGGWMADKHLFSWRALFHFVPCPAVPHTWKQSASSVQYFRLAIFSHFLHSSCQKGTATQKKMAQ